MLGLHDAHPDCGVGQSIQGMLVEVDRRAARAIEDELADTTIAQLVADAVDAANLRAGA